MVALHANVEQSLRVEMRRWGIGLSEYRALDLVANAADREIRLLDLADALDLNPSSVSRLVDRLAMSDWARRESCGDDRRGVFVAITDRGVDLLTRVGPAYEQALADALDHAGHTQSLGDVVSAILGSPTRS